MGRLYISRLIFWGVLLFGCVWGLRATQAYLLPPSFYLKQMVEARRGMTRLTVHMTASHKMPQGWKRYEERLFIQAPAKIRWERYKGDKPVAVHLHLGDQSRVWNGQGEAKEQPRVADPRWDFFAIESHSSGFGSLNEILGKLRIRTRGSHPPSPESDYREAKYMSLAWFKGRPAIVLGAPSKDRTANQIWIDKEHGYLVRFLGRLPTQKAIVDIQFLDYHRSGRGYLFPGRIEFSRGGKMTSQFLIHRVIAQKAIPASRFQQIP